MQNVVPGGDANAIEVVHEFNTEERNWKIDMA
jgi:hypothetical protein